jgi:hypothetical protein
MGLVQGTLSPVLVVNLIEHVWRRHASQLVESSVTTEDLQVEVLTDEASPKVDLITELALDELSIHSLNLLRQRLLGFDPTSAT